MKQHKFSIFIPLEIEKSSKTGEERYDNMKFKGIASNPNLGDDKQGQWLDPSGFDLNDFIKSGTFNWHHRWKDKPTAIVGEPTKAHVTRKNELYVEGTLYKSSQVARDIYDLAEVLQADSPNRRIGMSIEGIPTMVDPKNKNRILKARLTNIALTPAPICPGTSMELMKGGIDELQFETKEDLLIDVTDEHGVRWTVDSNLTLHKGEESEFEKGGLGSGRHKVGSKVTFKAKDVNGNPLYRGTHTVVSDNGKRYTVKGKGYQVEATHGEIELKKASVEDDDDDIEKGGEGSKGGNVIGHTKSGKPIYDKFDHPAHKNFTAQDHSNAITAHIDDVEKKVYSLKKKSGIEPTYDEAWKENQKESHAHRLAERNFSKAEEGGEYEIELQKAIEASEIGELEKGGEGSKGGKIIGHSKSGHPIYASAQEHMNAFKEHLKKRFKDPESTDHHNAVKHHIGHYLEKTGVSKNTAHKTPWMEDEMFGGGGHKNVKESASYLKEMADDIKEDEKDKIKKAMEAGSITGTETHNQSLTQQPLKQESIAGAEGKKKKRDYKKLLANLRKRRGDKEDSVIKDLSKGEVIEALVKEGLDQESAERVFELSDAIEKAEGSRGGKIIGHTKSGKPVYENKQAHTYKGFSKQDHKDAHEAHNKEAKRLHPYTLGKSGHDNKANKAHEKLDHHSTTADDHLAEYDTLSEKEHEERTKGGEGKMFSKDQLKKFRRSVDKSRGISKAEIFTTLLSDFNLDTESAKNVYMLAEAIEKAEGSRGGKIIGHTKSGKPVYDTANHEAHSDFSGSEHKEARTIHEKKAMKHYDTMHTAGIPVNKRKAAGQKYSEHMRQANSHMEKE